MPEVIIYYHDPVEVDPRTSWTALCPSLSHAQRIDIRTVTDPRVTDLFGYARPDAVITLDGRPVVSIEQTQMNPSGHNIPQRFSSQVRAAELGVPSILYYPEFARRTFSDPNVRYLQIRIPLAQLRLSSLYRIPALSVFWPTNPNTKLPETLVSAHQKMADVVENLVTSVGGRQLLGKPAVQAAIHDMECVIDRYAKKYRPNRSVRDLLPDGFSGARRGTITIDPPTKAEFVRTQDFAASLSPWPTAIPWPALKERFLSREYTIVFTGTANKSRTDSEHPWPGYLTLLDILYARAEKGRTPADRTHNLVYRLPVSASAFLGRLNRADPPTAARIVDTFADLLWLQGGLVLGRPLRGNVPAQAF